MFKVGDLVRIRPEWVREYEKIPVGIVTVRRIDGSMDVYWFADRRVYESEDPKAMILLNES